MNFNIQAPFKPAGDQPQAIKKLVDGYSKYPMQTLLGITGSGKSHVMAQTINKLNKPALILAHNKTLAAQLYTEMKQFFPENRVEYFISYYDYYQPESYLPTTDTYIEKEATVNKEIEKMRLRTMASLLSRDDVIVVASISCIYGAGNPEDYKALAITIEANQDYKRSDFLATLISMQYQRTTTDLTEGTFKVRGDTILIYPPYHNRVLKLEFFGDELETIKELEYPSMEMITTLNEYTIYPAKQFAIPEEKHNRALAAIRDELDARLKEVDGIEHMRLKKKVNYDLEMINEVGYCTGIENYSRHFDERKQGEPPFVLLDYFPKDFLLIIDESHQTLPQSHAMYKGDYARKANLVEYGFRLPSAFDNRPLKFEEFEKYFKHTIFVSATPAKYELDNSGQTVEMIIRPTGLLDPTIIVKPAETQVKDLIQEIKKELDKNTEETRNKVLVTTLTKKMAEDLTNYLAKEQLRVRYLHSEIDSLDRIELIKQMREDQFDILVGINLLREGLDIPEVSLVAILDADKEGFLRNERSLIQTIGRAARNANGRVIMYADTTTDSMTRAIELTHKRRELQQKHNKKHNITPKTIKKKVQASRKLRSTKHMSTHDLEQQLITIESDMKKAAENLDFEKAIELREELKRLEKELNS